MLKAAELLYRGASPAAGDHSRLSPRESDSRIIRTRLELRNLISQVIGFGGLLLDEANEKALRSFVLALGHTTEAARLLLLHVDEKLDPYRLSQFKAVELQQEILIFARQTIMTMQRLTAMHHPELSPVFREDVAHINKAAGHMLEIADGALAQLAGLAMDDFLEEVRSAEREAPRLPLGMESASRPSQAARRSPSLPAGHVLVVDDSLLNRSVLQQTLQRLGYQVVCTGDGHEALALLENRHFDVVLLDLIMPDMSGTTVLRRIKADPKLRDTRVIMVSASDGVDTVARCIEQGAEDYLVKPIHPVLLQARIDDCIERRRLHESERQTMKALMESQQTLAAELGEAAAYVKSLLPAPLDGPVSARWEFIPSRQLGGDALGYAWIDPDHFAFYLLDVSGHGIRAALLSITVMNLLRAGAVRDADYRDPANVLTALNGVFQMQDHNNMYFSIWYGVYHRPSRTLQYANAGHPPALLIREAGGASPALERLDAHGPIIGALPKRVYAKTSLELPPGSRLFLFSDGVYETRRPNGAYGQFEDFFTLVARQNPHTLDFEYLMGLTREIRGNDLCPDDYSLVGFRFRG